jgi:hypothetical protein
MVRYVRLTNTGRLVLDRYQSGVNQHLCWGAANGSTMTAFWPDLPEFDDGFLGKTKRGSVARRGAFKKC